MFTKDKPNGFSLVGSLFPILLFVKNAFAKLRLFLPVGPTRPTEKRLRSLNHFSLTLSILMYIIEAIEPGS